MWNLLKNLFWNQRRSPPSPGQITRTLLSASEILVGNGSSGLEEDFAMNNGFLFQAQIIEELALRVKALERQDKINVSKHSTTRKRPKRPQRGPP